MAAMHQLVAALSAEGPQGLATQLATTVSGWVLLLDAKGTVTYAAPPDARRYADRVRMDLDELDMHTPLHAASLTVADAQVAVLPVGVHGTVEGYLAAGRGEALTSVEQAALANAVGLLSMNLAAELAAREAERRDRRAVLELAVAGHPELAASTADTLGVTLPESPLRVAVIGCPRGTVSDTLQVAEEQHGLAQAGALVAQYDARTVVVLLPVAEGDLQALEEVMHEVPQARAVATEGVSMTDVPDALRRARAVYFGTPESADSLLLAKDVATAGLLAQLDTPGARGWSAALLEPLDRHARRSKLDLISTLRVFLANNGHMDASSTALGIHRHTLRYRLDRVTELLDCSLDDPTKRAELWLALRLRELT